MRNYKALQNGSDIRGTALKTEGGKDVDLKPYVAVDIALAFVAWLAARTGKNYLYLDIGRDPRVTGEELFREVSYRTAWAGCEVHDCGLATTPAMFMSTVFDTPNEPKADGAIMFTASHLPYDRNGMKFFTKDGGLDSDDIKQIIALAENMDDDFSINREWKWVFPRNLMKEYSQHLRNIICEGLCAEEKDKPLTGLHVVVDAGNGSGGFYVKDVLEPLGADCSGSQFLEPDGMFPNHAPNPEDKEALESICKAVKQNSADLGIIFDTDVDRAAAVGSDGKEIARNRIVGLAAYIASKGHPGTTIVTDSITSTQLTDFIEKDLGCRHFRYQRGYRNVINKGQQLNREGVDCLLAIETSGHAAMAENFFLDDGAYLATKIIIEAALLKKEGKHIEDLIAGLKDPLEAREVRFKVLAEDFSSYAQEVLDFVEAKAPKVPGWNLVIPNYEGVRVSVPGGWFLLRKSLHDPVMPLNIESDKEGGVEETLAKLKELLSAFDKLQ